MVTIITDSNSGITQNDAKKLGIKVVPMPVLINDEIYFEDISISQNEFYVKLAEYEQCKDDTVKVSTSQPTPVNVGEIWEDALKDADEVVYIPMSSGLSETCNTLSHYASIEERFNKKVFVVDNQRISITQRQSVMDALKMAKEGKSAEEIKDWLTKTKMESSIYIMVDTLKYLKKGGRCTPVVAMIGSLLKIKPVLQIQGKKLDQFKKVRKLADAKTEMIAAVKDDIKKRFSHLKDEGKLTLAIAHTQNFEQAELFKEEVLKEFPDIEFTFVDPLSLSVSCHIGPGALAIACTVKY